MLTIKIENHTVEVDPPINVYCVEVENSGGIWRETFGTAEARDMFLIGVRVLAEMSGTSVKWPGTFPPTLRKQSKNASVA